MALETLSTKLTTVLPQVIEHNLVQYTTAHDEFTQYWENTAEGVYSPDAYGRNWQVLVPIEFPQVAGAIEYSDVDLTDAFQDPTYTGVGWVANQVETYPGLDKMGLIGVDDQTMTLMKVKANFALPVELWHAQTFSAMAANLIARNIANVVKYLGLGDLESMYFDDTTKQISTVTSPSVTNKILTFTPGGGGVSFRFVRNMFIDIYDSTATTRRNNAVKIKILRVDHKAGTVVAADPAGSDLNTLGITSGDLVVLRASKGKGPNGLPSFIKNSGTILGLSTTTYPELKSYIRDLGGATLTSDVLQEVAAKYLKEFGPTRLCGVTTPEVINKHLSEFDTTSSGNNPSRYERQGQALDRVPGTKNVMLNFHYGNMEIPIHASAWVDPQTLYIANCDEGNLRRYVTPRVDEFGSPDPEFPQWIHFLFRFTDNGIFANVPVAAPGGQVEASNWMQAPCHAIYNRFAIKPQGIKFTTVGHLTNTYT